MSNQEPNLYLSKPILMASTDFDSYAKNYVTTNRYYVEIGSSIIACFSECSGVGTEIDKAVLR